MTHPAASSPLLPVQHLALGVDNHGWEDFPVYLTGKAAAELLACWTTLWHPQLMLRSGQIPHWQRLDQLPEQPEGWLLLVPTFAREQLPEETARRFVDRGGVLRFGSTCRRTLGQELLNARGREIADGWWPTADFFSLGYCYLQIQLMTRQLRYSSSLDEKQFQHAVGQALQTMQDRDERAYAQAMQQCFDLLREERCRYYPSNASLVDYVCLDEKHLGQPLQATLEQPNAITLQASGATLQSLLPKSAVAVGICERVAAGSLSLAGGEYRESRTALLSTWSGLRQLQRGWQALDDLVHQPLRVYARRRFGLHVALPGWLEQFDVADLVHATLDDGVFPQTAANQLRWEGLDHTVVSALVAPPKLAAAPETWLNLGLRIGEVMDINQYACLVFAHWPGDDCDSYRDVVNSSRFGPVLGQFVTLAEYFQSFPDPGFTQHYQVDDYRDPWLAQLVAEGQANPLSRFMAYWHRLPILMAVGGLQTMASLSDWPGDVTSPWRFLDELDELAGQAENGDFPQPAAAQDAEGLQGLLAEYLRPLTRPTDSGDGVVVFNPFSFPRRLALPLPGVDATHPCVLFADASQAVVEVPAMGFANLSVNSNLSVNGTSVAPPVTKKSPPLAEDVFLRNEFFAVEIDERTGGIGAVKLHGKRPNLIAQQIICRETKPGVSRSGRQSSTLSKMVAETLQVTINSRVQGQITTRGWLKRGDQKLASYRQAVTLTRGLPVIDVQMELEPLRMPQGNPWQNYYACRFAWQDETAHFYAWQNESRQRVVRSRCVSPLALEIDQHEFQTSILPGGSPWFQRSGQQRVDSLMLVAGESCRRWNLGIGINLAYPWQWALSRLAPDCTVPGVAAASSISHAWLFHLNCKNVVALYWILSEQGAGVRVLLKEVEGRRAELTLKCCRNLEAAHVQNLAGRVIRQLSPENGQVQVTLSAFEMTEVSLFW